MGSNSWDGRRGGRGTQVRARTPTSTRPAARTAPPSQWPKRSHHLPPPELGSANFLTSQTKETLGTRALSAPKPSTPTREPLSRRLGPRKPAPSPGLVTPHLPQEHGGSSPAALAQLPPGDPQHSASHRVHRVHRRVRTGRKPRAPLGARRTDPGAGQGRAEGGAGLKGASGGAQRQGQPAPLGTLRRPQRSRD